MTARPPDQRPPKADAAEEEEISLASSVRLLILALVLGMVLLVSAVLLLGTNHVGRQRAGVTQARAVWVQVAKKESKLFDDLDALGGRPGDHKGRYQQLLNPDDPGLAPDAALGLVDDLDEALEPLQPVTGSSLNATYKRATQRLVRLRKAQQDWETAAELWQGSVRTPHGAIVVAIGLEQGPP